MYPINSYSFKALIFSGDRLLDSLEFETKNVKKELSEATMKSLFEKLYKKYLPEDTQEHLIDYAFNDNMQTNFSGNFATLSKEVSYYLDKNSSFYQSMDIEDLNINLSLEYFY